MSYPGLHAERRRRPVERASAPIDERSSLLPDDNRPVYNYDGGRPARSYSSQPISRKNLCYIFLTFLILVGALIIFSVDTLTPTQYGLVYNRVTGVVYDTPYAHGRHFIGPTNVFLKFPSNYQYLEFSENPKADHKPIQARTGRDLNDADSGGQPIDISVAFTYQLDRKLLRTVYKNFAMDYEKRYIQFAMQSISDITQRFHPSAFWNDRATVADTMQVELNKVLRHQGYVRVRTLQLLRLEFLPGYETTIVGIQLAVQQRTTNEYRQQVVSVLKDIDIRESITHAAIANITSKAEATAMLNLNAAAAVAFNITQHAKAVAYSNFGKGLKLFEQKASLLQYIRVRNIRQHTTSNLTIAFEHPVARLRKAGGAAAAAAATAAK